MVSINTLILPPWSGVLDAIGVCLLGLSLGNGQLFPFPQCCSVLVCQPLYVENMCQKTEKKGKYTWVFVLLKSQWSEQQLVVSSLKESRWERLVVYTKKI